jgi:hypothetical protein
MVVGLSAAIVQGANTSTQDIDLWFAIISNPQSRCAGARGDPAATTIHPP